MIKVIYNKVCGRCVQSEPLTSGMVGQPIHFEYSHDFDGLAVTAVFTDGKNTVDVVNPGNECIIPHEVLTTVGAIVKVGIYAVRGNEIVIPTVYANIGTVLKGADPSGDVSADPTLPVWAQIQALMGNLNDLDTEAKNNLVAAINEAAQSGGGGGSASITMRVDSGYIQYSTDNGKTWVNLIAEADLKGDDGTDGITPHIGDNGNWYLGATDTGKPSRGAAGSAGQAGKDGKSAYQYAQEGGYTGTETEFAEKLASDALIVLITDNNGTLSADKTFTEIRDAILAGIPVYIWYDGYGYPVIAVTADALSFGTIMCANDDYGAFVATAIIEITQNGEVNDISATVETLPNPNAITFTGAVTGIYDGSAPLTVNIPSGEGGTGGGSSGTWELIGEATSDGAGTNAGISIPCDISGYKSVFVYAQNLPKDTNFRIVMRTTLMWTNVACFFGYNLIGKQGSFSFGAQSGKMNNPWSITGLAYNVANRIFAYGAAEAQYNGGSAMWRQGEQSNNLPTESWANVKYISLDRNSSTDIVPEGCILRAWGCK